MDADPRVTELFELLQLNDNEKRKELVRLGKQGRLQIDPEQPANFRLDSMTLDNNEDACAELA
jgi:hypothetical protein